VSETASQRELAFEFVTCPAGDPRARYCVEQYFSELDERFAGGFDSSTAIPALDEEMTPPAGLFIVALSDAESVGCVGLKFHGEEPAEMKRLWVSRTVRGRGLGRRLVAMIEELAVLNGAKKLRLDTNHTLVEAIAMYRASGYRQVPAFDDEIYADHWFEKELKAGTAGSIRNA
jgi:ribosomal protein S18 acetylase RimI-like enzyme